MINNAMDYPLTGKIKTNGYAGKITELTLKKQYLDESLWKVTVEQYKIKSDDANGDWRGEYWGKLMRGACLTYRATGSKKLYSVITASVKDMLSAQDKNGRFSTYTEKNEFTWWDMWCRKYVMLGFIYYIEICRNETLKRRILRALKKHADYIMKRVGAGKGKVGICDTSIRFGALNSCSILEPFVKLYSLTGEKKYLDYSEYIIGTGLSKDFDVYKACLTKNSYPYEFKYTKAYEMTSCIEGVLEYYKVTGKTECLTVAKNFADMVAESDYTIIGCAGCTNELFDHSSVKQTEFSEDVMQETCVTVTLMGLFTKLLEITGEAKYAALIEKSGYNALFGAVNTENQSMKSAQGYAWKGDEMYSVAHEAFLFDSYSPLYMNRRATLVGGFQVMPGGRSYGCCVSIGGAGTATFDLSAVMKGNDGFFVNLYNDEKYRGEFGDKPVELAVKANVYGKDEAKISVLADGEFSVALRIPEWCTGFKVIINGEEAGYTVKNGYAVIRRLWKDDNVTVKFPAKVKAELLNGKIAFTRGAITLARDERFGEDISAPVKVKINADGYVIGAKIVRNELFNANLTVRIKTDDGEITLCDYSSAGKNVDDENCKITVWQNQ